MATKQIVVEISDELWEILGPDERALSAQMREALVVERVRQHDLSARYAAQLLGLEVLAFAELMERHGVEVFVEPSLLHVTAAPKPRRPRAPRRTLAVIGLQQHGYISMREAAEELGLSYEGYLRLLSRHGYPVSQGVGDPALVAALSERRAP